MTEGYIPSAQELGITKEKLNTESNLTRISEEESLLIQEKIRISGDSFRERELSKDMLISSGLGPRWKVGGEGKAMWFSSSTYEVESGREAVVAYVEQKEKLVPRAYYRSNSQGVWRFLPAYTVRGEGEKESIVWYNKGYGEESITLPVNVQKALSEISREEPRIEALPDPELIFAGMSRRTDVTRSYALEVSSVPDRLKGNFYADTYGKKVPPEKVKFKDSNQSPDFSKLASNWQEQTSLYGQISIEAYPSKDGHLTYMFCRDSLGRAWIGGIEDDSAVTSTGLRERWVTGGDLTTPAFEYATEQSNQTGGYGNDKLKSYPYVDMYEKYLSKIPVIMEYQQLKNKDQEGYNTQPTIENSQNLVELYRALYDSGGLQGSEEYFTPAQLEITINRVRDGGWPIEYITRSGGLRQKVADLLGKKIS